MLVSEVMGKVTLEQAADAEVKAVRALSTSLIEFNTILETQYSQWSD